MALITQGTLFGKNKGVALRKGVEQTLADLEQMQIAPEAQKAYEQAQLISKRGFDPYTRAQMLTELGRKGAGLYNRMGTARYGGQDIATMMNEQLQKSILGFGAASEQQRRENAQLGISTGMSLGQQKLALQQYKTQGLYNYLTGRLKQRADTLTGLITGIANVGSNIGAAALKGVV